MQDPANKILYSILEKSYIIWITNIISNIVTCLTFFDYDADTLIKVD